MIQGVEQCSNEETNAQIEYLISTPVSGITEYLINGQLKLSKGNVESLEFLGSLKTEFGVIGSIVPKSMEGQKKFRVSELVPALKNHPTVDDGGLLKKIESIASNVNEIEFNITVLALGNELIIKDGNKRTIAFYENRKESLNRDICYPVYIVHE